MLTQELIRVTAQALQHFALLGARDGGHEGIVFWAGVESPPWTVFTTAVVPQAEHSPQRVHVTEKSYGEAVEAAAAAGAAVLAQVHSHPGADARHSDGDDDLVILPFDGMLSVVVPRFAEGWDRLSEAGVHQYQNGLWTLCDPDSIAERIAVVPALIDAGGAS